MQPFGRDKAPAAKLMAVCFVFAFAFAFAKKGRNGKKKRRQPKKISDTTYLYIQDRHPQGVDITTDKLTMSVNRKIKAGDRNLGIFRCC